MKLFKTIVLTVLIVVATFFAVILVFGEPVENLVFDSGFGIFLMKFAGFCVAGLAVWFYYKIPEDYRYKFESWLRLHF